LSTTQLEKVQIPPFYPNRGDTPWAPRTRTTPRRRCSLAHLEKLDNGPKNPVLRGNLSPYLSPSPLVSLRAKCHTGTQLRLDGLEVKSDSSRNAADDENEIASLKPVAVGESSSPGLGLLTPPIDMFRSLFLQIRSGNRVPVKGEFLKVVHESCLCVQFGLSAVVSA